MSVRFLIVLALAMGIEPAAWPDGAVNPWRTVGLVTLAEFSVVALAWFISGATARRLRLEPSPTLHDSVLRRYGWLRAAHAVVAVLVYAAALRRLGWTALTRTYIDPDWFALDEIVLLLPFLAAEAMSLACFYSVDQAAHRGSMAEASADSHRWTLASYLSFQLRARYGIWLSVIVTFMAVTDAISYVAGDWLNNPYVAGIALGGSGLFVMAIFPIFFRVAWDVSPLPAGELRQRLEAVGARVDFRYSDILVWNTRGGVANAAITGLFPQVRYVLLTDSLVRQLEPVELEAVFGHEVGHVQHRHLSYLFLLVLASTTSVTLFVSWLVEFYEERLAVEPVATIVRETGRMGLMEWLILAPMLFFTVGSVSRRFERQADVYGSRVVSGDGENEHCNSGAAPNGPKRSAPRLAADGINAFVSALEKVSRANGSSRTSWSWRHGTIERRIAFLRGLETDPERADEFDREVATIRRRWLIGLALSIAAFAALVSLR